MIWIVKDRSFYLVEMITTITQFRNSKKKKYNQVRYSQIILKAKIILEKVQILVNRLRIIIKLMMKIGRVKKKMQKKIKKKKRWWIQSFKWINEKISNKWRWFLNWYTNANWSAWIRYWFAARWFRQYFNTNIFNIRGLTSYSIKKRR